MRDCAFEVFLNHRQGAADKIAVAIGQVAVVALDQRVEAEAPILSKRNLAQKKVAKNVGGEQILFALPVLIAQNRARTVDGFGLESAEGVQNRLGADDIAARLATS